MRQLTLFDAPPPAPIPAFSHADPAFPRYDRHNRSAGPLCAHEVACCAHHGMTLVAVDAETTTMRWPDDTPETLPHAEWREMIDIWYIGVRRGTITEAGHVPV